jgi:hypothetical protein
MAEGLSRKALYDLVWTEPLRTLCERFGLSDVALLKTCQRAMVPTPERGYWARKAAGKKTWVLPLPERPPAMDDEIQVGGKHEYRYRTWTNEEILGPLPPPPQFDPNVASLRERIAKTIGKVTVPREDSYWHPAIVRLLEADEQRREKQAKYSWSSDKSILDEPEARRRLRILNALFFAVGKFHGKPNLDKEAFGSYIFFYNQALWVKLAPVKNKGAAKELTSPLTLSIMDRSDSAQEIVAWSDGEVKIEASLGDAAVEVVYQAELAYRKGAALSYRRRKERKAELEEEIRESQLHAEKVDRERLAKLQKERIGRLLRDATSFDQAATIRRYVETVCTVTEHSPEIPPEKIKAWSRWALEPIRSTQL